MSALALMMLMGNNLTAVDSADFDGTNDYMTTGAGLTGAADSKTGILSVWVRLDGGDGLDKEIISDAVSVGGNVSRFFVIKTTSNLFRVFARNAAGTTIMQLQTVSTYLAGSTWLHVLMSWDLAASAEHLYVNDVSDLSVTTSTDDTIDYTTADWSIGAIPNGVQKFDGPIAECYFAPGQYLDFSVTANRRKFISAQGKPVSLGADGAFPTGTAPLVYLHLADGEAVANFATNRGTGGNFSITGTLETGSTSPSD